jgi:aspartate/methionine/tyrosine aminotransferase
MSTVCPPLKIARRAAVAPFIAMDVLAAANQRAARGQDVIHLEVGEPGGGPPAAVLEAARAALGRLPLGYTEALGRPALRRAIATHYRTRYGLEVDPEQVIVTVGASGAFVLTFLAAFEPGDRVVVPEPASRPTRTSCRRSASRWSGSASGRRPASRRRSSCCRGSRRRCMAW